MGKAIIALPKKFPIKLTTDPAVILDPTIGGHKQHVVRANGLEIARFMDEESSHEYIKFLSQTGFHCFTKTLQGKAIMEKIYLMGEKEKLKPETDGKQIIIRSIDQPDT